MAQRLEYDAQGGSLPLRSFSGGFRRRPFSRSRRNCEPCPTLAAWAYVLGVLDRCGFHRCGGQHRDSMDGSMGAFMLGVMFALWFLILHSPRSVAASLSHNPTGRNEWASAFVALAICGGSWIVASHAQ